MLKAGDRFSYLTVVKRDPKGGTGKTGGAVRFIVRCDCGTIKSVTWSALAYAPRPTQSCGCMRRKLLAEKQTRHGYSIKNDSIEFRTYIVWQGMLWRCNNKNRPDYHRYGGRGIKVCERWMAFENFLADMGLAPKERTLGRIDNDGDYEPSNCEWQTAIVQGNNRSTNHIITVGRKSQTVAMWARESGVGKSTIQKRLAAGWSDERAVTCQTMR